MKTLLWFVIVLLCQLVSLSAFADQPAKADREEFGRLVETCKGSNASIKVCLVALREAMRLLEPLGCATVKVDYGLSISALAGADSIPIFREGKYMATPRGTGKATRDVCWFSPDGKLGKDPLINMSIQESIARIEGSGEYRLVDLWEFSALRQAKPDLEPVAILGSMWFLPEGGVLFPDYSRIDGKPGLGVVRLDSLKYSYLGLMAAVKVESSTPSKEAGVNVPALQGVRWLSPPPQPKGGESPAKKPVP